MYKLRCEIQTVQVKFRLQDEVIL